ncbi:MAG: non-canonical purine NTP pyrophosphatase [Marmoricola sp.]
MPDGRPRPQVFLASRNAKKLAEMQRLLAEHLPDIEVLGLDDVTSYDEPVEDAPDFAGNALLKARAGLAVTGIPSLADDSGLCVAALNGMPGVLSARWSGGLSGKAKDDDANNALVLAQLGDVPDGRRGAQFRCAVAFCYPDSSGVAEEVMHGAMPGRVIRECRGAGGFGYDVLFVPDEQDGELTSAELSAEQKDAISHRGKALREIAPLVVEVLTGAGGGIRTPTP